MWQLSRSLITSLLLASAIACGGATNPSGEGSSATDKPGTGTGAGTGTGTGTGTATGSGTSAGAGNGTGTSPTTTGTDPNAPTTPTATTPPAAGTASSSTAPLPSGVSAAAQTGGQPVDDGIIPQPNRTDWLKIQGNKFITSTGSTWLGRGVTLHDTRSCDWCTSHSPNVPELKRRVDAAVHDWHVNFIRLLLQSFPAATYPDGSGNRVQWATMLADPQYLHDIQEIVEYIGTKPGVFVEVSLWKDPGFTDGTNSAVAQSGLPTAASNKELAKLATLFAKDAHVMFGVANEPEEYVDTLEANCVSAMSTAVQTIRAVENSLGTPHHIVAVQGTEGWARLISYYVTHPVAGDNVAYETHPYTAATNFENNIWTPAQTLPVIIGEFAPSVAANMNLADCELMMQQADAHNVPWAAWDFHSSCNSRSGTNNMLLQETGKCVYGIPLTPSAGWGQAVQAYILGKQ